MSSIKYRNSANDTWQELQVIIGPQGPAGATGATGPAGATGATGPQGPAGANGADGNGIASIVLNNDYTLTITYTDGTSTTTSSIRGPQGAQGSTGPAGTYTAGTNITIENGVISATGGSNYTAGTGIDITNNEISVDATDLSYNDLQNKPTIPTVPTNVSAFTNDAGYLTAHQSLTGYATETYVNQAIAQVPAGTTYTAGTGISISNGVISLALANASQEAM